jgi:hypothetical protein
MPFVLVSLIVGVLSGLIQNGMDDSNRAGSRSTWRVDGR